MHHGIRVLRAGCLNNFGLRRRSDYRPLPAFMSRAKTTARAGLDEHLVLGHV
jgi:hypothetical protein